jgi:hypothetical protein
VAPTPEELAKKVSDESPQEECKPAEAEGIRGPEAHWVWLERVGYRAYGC